MIKATLIFPAIFAGLSLAEPIKGQFNEEPEPIEINAYDNSFGPVTVQMAPGQKGIIKLTNRGKHQHGLTLSLPSQEKTTGPKVKPGESKQFSFEAPKSVGEYEYFCPDKQHKDAMRGKLIVTENAIR